VRLLEHLIAYIKSAECISLQLQGPYVARQWLYVGITDCRITGFAEIEVEVIKKAFSSLK